MTAVLPEAAAVDLAALSDGELAGMLGAALDAGDTGTVTAVEAEAGRRDRADRDAEAARRAQERRTARQTAYYEVMHAQYLAASEACRGRLLSPAGVRAGIREVQLWQVGERDALRYASEELRTWWHYNGRLTYRQWDAGTSEAAAQRYELDRADREQAEPTEAEPVTVTTTEPITDRSTPVKTECKHPWRAGPARCGDCPRRAAQPATVDPIAARAARREARAEARTALRARISGQPAPATVPSATVGAEVALRPAKVIVRQRPEVDGDEALRFARAFLGRFGYWPSESALTAATLWAAHSHARDARGMLVWDATPRLYLLSPEPGSGKTTLLELVGRLCPAVPGIDVEPSEAGLAHTIGNEHATVLLDEGDVLFGTGRRKASIRAILNAGYTRHGTWLRMRGSTGVRVPVFGALALAALDSVETDTGDMLAALMSRGIKIRVRRCPDDLDLPRLGRREAIVGGQIAARLAAWTAERLTDLQNASETVQAPAGVRNRAEQIWRPLLAVAEVAGGDWPELAAQACTDLTLSAPAEAEEPDEEDVDDLRDLVASWA